MTVVLGDLIAVTEEWVKEDPRWQQFRQSFGEGWDLKLVIMDEDEKICFDSKIIYLPMFRWPDPKFRAAHAVAHIKYHWGAAYFTVKQCDYADAWVTYKLAMDGQWV